MLILLPFDIFPGWTKTVPLSTIDTVFIFEKQGRERSRNKGSENVNDFAGKGNVNVSYRIKNKKFCFEKKKNRVVINHFYLIT